MHEQRLARQQELTPAVATGIVRRQLEDECREGRIAPRPAEELARVATTVVDALWAQSRIKLFLPVLAVRQARADLGWEGARRDERMDLLATLETGVAGLAEVHLTHRADGHWHAILVRHEPRGAAPESRWEGEGATVRDALTMVIAAATRPT